jgi:3D (Asp-Asp-Asp) domain-containing protein
MNLKQQRFLLIILFVSSMAMHLVYGIEGTAQRGALEQKLDKQAAQLRDQEIILAIQDHLISTQDYMIREYIDQEPVEVEDEPEYIGEFVITYYTSGPESTGKTPDHPAYGITRSGTTVKEGQTIAADWDVLPAGTRVYIEGVGERIVEDTGGDIVGQAIDVYVEDVDRAMDNGRHMARVWIVEEAENGTLYD